MRVGCIDPVRWFDIGFVEGIYLKAGSGLPDLPSSRLYACSECMRAWLQIRESIGHGESGAPGVLHIWKNLFHIRPGSTKGDFECKAAIYEYFNFRYFIACYCPASHKTNSCMHIAVYWLLQSDGE